MEAINKHSIKIQLGVLFGFVVLVVSVVYQLTSYKNKIELQVNQCKDDLLHSFEDVDDNAGRIKNLELKGQERDVEYAEIKIKLIGIETSLTEIKEELRK